MNVILRENVSNLGSMGDMVKVANGYARNYLIPRKLAVAADSASAKQIEHEKRDIKRREEQLRTKLQELAREISRQTVEIKARAGEEDKIFGSVTSAMIVAELQALHYSIDRKNIHLEEPIKALGIYTVPVSLGLGVDASVKVWVVSEQEAVQEEAGETEGEAS
jgi:large subunit ribosomal protein L9